MSAPKTNPSAAHTRARPVVYVVDDEVMILELISVVLSPLGFEVVTFPDPALAFEAFRETSNRPALIITDYAMHSMNGMELIEKCKAVAPDQKIVLASGTVGEDVYANALAKPDRFLPKPFETTQLVAVVRELTGGEMDG